MRNSMLMTIALIAAVVVSCEKTSNDGVLAMGYGLIPSDCVSQKLFVSATLIPEKGDCHMSDGENYPSYTSFKDVLIRFAPCLSDDIKMSTFSEILGWSDEQQTSVGKWAHEHLKPVYLQQFKERHRVHAPCTTSCMEGHLSIKADKEVYGMEPGSDISSHFEVRTINNYGIFYAGLLTSFDYRMKYPLTFDKEEKASLPTELDDFFFDDEVLFCAETSRMHPPHAYCLVFKDYPEENPEELTLTIEIPVKELLIAEAFDSDDNFDLSLAQMRERTLSGSIHLSF